MTELKREQWERLFPFHVGFDATLRVTALGRSLRRLVPDDALGRGLLELFTLERPVIEPPSLAAILARQSAVFLLGVRERPLRLRGEVVTLADGALFVGAPWLTELGQMKEAGIGLRDLALHDPTGELLVVLKTTETSIVDARQMAERLQEETRRRDEALRELQEKLAVIEEQRRAIRVMSSPIVQLWDGVIAVPLVGTIDGERTARLMENLLEAILARRARCAILDVTGVEAIDAETADNLARIVRAARLLGARAMLSGIGPAVAQTIVDLGLDLAGAPAFASLQEALKACLAAQGPRPSAGSSSAPQASRTR
jgi:anti-anti-sigma regulatory factor